VCVGCQKVFCILLRGSVCVRDVECVGCQTKMYRSLCIVAYVVYHNLTHLRVKKARHSGVRQDTRTARSAVAVGDANGSCAHTEIETETGTDMEIETETETEIDRGRDREK